MTSLRACVVFGSVAIALPLTACSGSPHRDVVSRVAASFVSAVQRHDGTAACALLSPDARSSVVGATNVPCSKAILTVDEAGKDVTGVQVWGDAAQVRIGDDVVFLRRLQKHWLVSAAGCTQQPAGPYDCDVAG